MIFGLLTIVSVIVIVFLGATQVVLPLWNDQPAFPMFKKEKKKTRKTQSKKEKK